MSASILISKADELLSIRLNKAKAVDGEWKTINGRPVFIETGKTLGEAMAASGKFKESEIAGSKPSGKKTESEKKPESKPASKPEEKRPEIKEKPSEAKPEAKPEEKKPEPKSDGKFNAEEWGKKPMGERREEWEKMPISKRDDLADASKSVTARRDELTNGLPKHPDTGDAKKDIAGRVDHFKDRISPEASKLIKKTIDDLHSNLEEAGADKAAARKLTMDALDTIAAQEIEGMGRTLGDHGIHHIEGNIRMSMQTLDAVPGIDTARDKAIVQVAQLYHDAGYMTKPAQNFLDEDHPRWSQEHYEANVRPMVEKALGARAAQEVSHIIRTHNQTDMDWKNDPNASASRLADNTALFHAEKMPSLFRMVPSNTEVLKQLGKGEISTAQAKSMMQKNVKNGKLPEYIEKRLMAATEEVSEVLPKLSLGMLGGEVSKIGWKKDHVVVKLKENKANTEANKLGDFGQKQFAKFAKTYGEDPASFQKKRNFKFEKKGSGIVFEGEWE